MERSAGGFAEKFKPTVFLCNYLPVLNCHRSDTGDIECFLRKDAVGYMIRSLDLYPDPKSFMPSPELCD